MIAQTKSGYIFFIFVLSTNIGISKINERYSAVICKRSNLSISPKRVCYISEIKYEIIWKYAQQKNRILSTPFINISSFCFTRRNYICVCFIDTIDSVNDCCYYWMRRFYLKRTIAAAGYVYIQCSFQRYVVQVILKIKLIRKKSVICYN